MTPINAPYSLDHLPESIWIPKFAMSQACYHGSPLEMLQDLAREMGPTVGVEDAIRCLLDELGKQGMEIHIPSATEAPRPTRAALLILVLLLTGYAREVPQA